MRATCHKQILRMWHYACTNPKSVTTRWEHECVLHFGPVFWLVWSMSPGAWLRIAVRSFLLKLVWEKHGLPPRPMQLLALCNRCVLHGRESSSLLAFGFAELINQVWASQVFGRFCGVMSRTEVPVHVASESSVVAKTPDQLK